MEDYAYRRFYEAVQELNLSQIEHCLNNSDPNINACIFGKRSHKKKPAIYYAARKGREDIVQLLLDKKADVNFADRHQRHLLHIAAWNGFTDVVRRLITDFGVEAECKDWFKRTPIMFASESGHLETVKLLVEECKSDVYHKDDMGRTPLNYAIKTGKKEVVGYFLANNPDIKKYFDADPYIFPRGEVSTNNPLSIACMGGQEEIVTMLLDAGAPLKVNDEFDVRPLQKAAAKGYLAIVVELVNHGVNVNDHAKGYYWPFDKVEDEPTPLISAAFHGHINIVQYLLNNGALPHIPCNGRTAYDTVKDQLEFINDEDHEERQKCEGILDLLKTSGKIRNISSIQRFD